VADRESVENKRNSRPKRTIEKATPTKPVRTVAFLEGCGGDEEEQKAPAKPVENKPEVTPQPFKPKPIRVHIPEVVPTSFKPKQRLVNKSEPELAYSASTLSFTLVTLNGDTRLNVIDGSKPATKAGGEFLYVKHGDAAQISVGKNSVTHLFYNPDSGDVYYTTDGTRYKKAAVSDVEFVEQESVASIDLQSIANKGRNANKALEVLKKDYFTLLQQGLEESSGKPVDLSWLNTARILDDVKMTTVVMTDASIFDTQTKKGNITNIVIGQISNKMDDFSDLIAHEFTHAVMDAQEAYLGGTITGITTFLYEGVTEAVSNTIQSKKYGKFSLAYGPDTTLALAYQEILGPEKFLKAVFDPSQVSLQEDMAPVLKQADLYEKMRLFYLVGIKGAVSPQYDSDPNVNRFHEMPFTVRFLGEYGNAKNDEVKLFSALQKDLSGASNFNSSNLAASYGLTEDDVGGVAVFMDDSFLHRSFQGGRIIDWYVENPPFDLVTDVYVKDRTNPLTQRYKQELLLLNSLDYKGMDFSHQQIAFGVLAKMTMDFSAYWDNLSETERASPDKQNEVATMVAVTEVLAIRFGYSFWAHISPKLKNGISGQKIDLGESDFDMGRPSDPAVAYMKIDRIEYNITNTSDYTSLDKTAPWSNLADATVTIYLKESFSYELTAYTEGNRQYQVKVSAPGATIDLQFVNQSLTSVTGVSNSFNQVQ
ncbi:MAG: hypothetical protein V1492_01065, partial [Candidatus Micrarchaeota archaeon]